MCLQDSIVEHSKFQKALEEDLVLTVSDQVDLDSIIGIPIANMKASGYTVGEIGAGAGAFTKQVILD